MTPPTPGIVFQALTAGEGRRWESSDSAGESPVAAPRRQPVVLETPGHLALGDFIIHADTGLSRVAQEFTNCGLHLSQ